MKWLLLIVLFVALSADRAQAQEWWQGKLGPPPSVPEGRPVGSLPASGGGQRMAPNDAPERRPARQVENEPRSPSRSELAQEERRRKQRHAHTQQIKGELARISQGFQIQRVRPTVELSPRGNNYFNQSPGNGERPFGQIMVASLSGIGTPATRIPLENLRQAAAIMMAMKPDNMGAMSEEDMSYLAGQSALAMEGAPLSVQIRDLPRGREDATRHLVQQAQDIETLRATAERATTERLRVEEQLVRVQNTLRSGTGDTAALTSQRETLLRSYRAAYIDEANKKATVKEKTGKVREVWH